jgi:hypothetical protein
MVGQVKVDVCAAGPVCVVGEVPRERRHEVKMAVVKMGGPYGHFEGHDFVLNAHVLGVLWHLDPQAVRVRTLPGERLAAFVGGFDAVDVLHWVTQGV